MDPQVASIRQAIADTRAAMTQKIELLEGRVQQTVHGSATIRKNTMTGQRRIFQAT